MDFETAWRDGDGVATFAFHDLDYIPHGTSGVLAPYIETTAGTMRAAATLMNLIAATTLVSARAEVAKTVICDLGCGDGDFLIGLLNHINASTLIATPAMGIGVDYSPELIRSAIANSDMAGVDAQWLIYDFNEDQDDIFHQLTAIHHVTHVFIYLLPKQLELKTVRRILTRLWEGGVMVCCHKYQPGYLLAARSDELMDLVVYDRYHGGEIG